MEVVIATFLLRLMQVEEATGLKKSAIYTRIKEDTFPVPVRLGVKAVAWRSDEIQAWINNRPRAMPRGAGVTQENERLSPPGQRRWLLNKNSENNVIPSCPKQLKIHD